MAGDDETAIHQLVLHHPHLLSGLTSSLRTLIIATFRAPNTVFMLALLRELNPTKVILKAAAFCRYHEYLFALLCMLNVNMGALDLSAAATGNTRM